MESEFKKYHGAYRGIVVDDNDPLKLGRVKVEVAGVLGAVTTDWAMPELPAPLLPGVGIFLGSGKGAKVWVTFENGNPDLPVYRGGWATAGTNNTSELPPTARGVADTSSTNKGGDSFAIVPGGTRSEPASPFAAVYPNNKVWKTTTGHVLEVDDTPGAERIHVYHKSGSLVEFHPDGKVVLRARGRMYQFVDGDLDVHATGHLYVKADGNVVLDGDRIGLGGVIKLARVGDTVAVGSGSSAGGWPIVTGSSKARAG